MRVDLRGALRGVRWYLREISGESAYDAYLERHRLAHPDTPVLSRRAFERLRADERDARPQTRCC